MDENYCVWKLVYEHDKLPAHTKYKTFSKEAKCADCHGYNNHCTEYTPLDSLEGRLTESEKEREHKLRLNEFA